MRSFFCGLLLLALSTVLFAGTPVVRSITKGVELANDRVNIVISGDAELLSCVDRITGEDIATSEHKKMASVILSGGLSLDATKIALQDNLLTLFFGSRKVETKVEAFNDFFTIEVLKVPSDIESLTFLDLKMKYDYSSRNPFLATGVALTLLTNQVFYPTGESKEITGRCYARTGLVGAKLAVVACHRDDLRSILKDIYRSAPKGAILVNQAGGGPFALDGEANRYDCVIMREANPSMVPEWIRFYSNLGINQFDFLKGSSTFTQGDFSFPGTGSAASFKKQITDPLYEAGIISTLHTYSYYISYTANEILSNPQWQQQLEIREVFTLTKSLDTSATSIDVSGNKTALRNDNSFRAVHSPFLLIDNEIIKYTIGESGFVSCKRGQCGTKAAAHKAGAKVRLIGGYYSHIAPQIGSDLYYEIARRTAKAYNEGGFRGFYFDAFDGLGVHLKYAGLSDYLWYYGAAFINEVLKHCEREPLVVEYSDMIHSVWSARGRGGAWDTPARGYKNFIDDHLIRNKTLMDRQYVTTFGWYNFYPTKKEQPGNYSTKYMFFDDVDYLGAKTVAYDQTMVYNGLLEKDVESIPALKRNLELYAQYNRLRQSGYFSEKVKSVLKEGEYEYKLAQKGGVWGFKETVYNRAKLRDITKDVLVGNNPFKRQKPFVRLENQYSSDCSSSISLLRFNETTDAFGQKCEASFFSPLNMSNHLAIKITVKGKGRDSAEALCIRLRSASPLGYADYVVRLNFDGWRDVVLPNLDNAENPDLKFKGMDDNLYNMHRRDVDFSRVNSIQLFKTTECTDVRVRRVDAVPLVANALAAPTITLGSASIAFQDTLQSGEYIEYYAGEKTAQIYDSLGNSRTVKVSRRGRFRVPHGVYQAYVSGEPKQKDAPSEVVLTIGAYGQFIKN